MNKKICLLVEDQKSFREWMTQVLLEVFEDMEIVSFSSVKGAHAWLSQNGAKYCDNFYFALIDLGLPDGSGIELIAYIKSNWPQITCVVASVYDDDHHLFDALAAGATGYLLKDREPDVMVNYLKRIEKAEPPLSPSIARRIMAHFNQQSQLPAKEETLTSRENETLALLARGLTNAEVAKKMGLSSLTVASYVKVIYQKLNVNSRAEAALKAVKRGLA